MPTRPLNAEESRFLTNERKLCALDFSYYCRYAQIIDVGKHVVPFIPNVAQSIVLRLWGQLESRALAVGMIQNKARQLGVSTLTELAVAHRVQCWPRTNALVASSTPEKSRKLSKMIGFAWAHMPWWLMPAVTKIANGLPIEFGELDSALTIDAGNQKTGVGRGDTPNVVHVSEVCEWLTPYADIESALLRAVHESPDVFFVMESTALGRDNYWHEKWEDSKVNWPKGRARLCPVFLPWFVGTDIYPTSTWLRARPIPHNWIPTDHTMQHAVKAREYVLTNPLLFEHLAGGDRDWQLPQSQMWYYEVERDAAIRQNALNRFLSEMPASDIESFQSTKISAISSETLLFHREHTREPIGVYAIVGDGIPQSLVPSRRLWDLSKPIIPIRCSQLLPNCTDSFQLVPLRYTGLSETDPLGKLFIWEHPQDDDLYGVGADAADGLGQDRTVFEVLRKGTINAVDQQVAEFASDQLSALQAWPISLAISTYYSTFQPRQQRRVCCRVAIECRANGEIIQHEMKKRGWSNFHPWVYYDNKVPTPGELVYKEGVFTNFKFRAEMLDILLTYLDECTLSIRSPWFVKEMESLVRDPSQQKIQAGGSAHDDRIMAVGFILFSLHIHDRPDKQFSRRRAEYQPWPDDKPPVYATFPVPDYAKDGATSIGVIPLEQRRSIYGRSERVLGRFTNPQMPKNYR